MKLNQLQLTFLEEHLKEEETPERRSESTQEWYNNLLELEKKDFNLLFGIENG
jgi:hypothetical protein